ncbi:MAG: hypothetical protein JXQ90_17675 [Cyclobacteriaceae bacterium]
MTKREHAAKLTWWIMRTLFFVYVGLMFTLFAGPEAQGSLGNYIGYGMLGFAVIDSFLISRDLIIKKH